MWRSRRPGSGRTVEATVRQVDGSDPNLRDIHEERTREAFAAFFRRQGDELQPQIASGAVGFDADRWNRDLAAVVHERGKDTAADFGSLVHGLAGRSVRFDPDLMDPWLDEFAWNTAENINDATRESAEQAAADDNPSDAGADLFDGLETVRAGVYAAAVTVTAANFGAQDGAKAAGLGTKTWQHGGGRDPRSDHAAMDGETVGIDETFSNGMKWPGDPAGGAEEVAHCQCSVTFN